MSSHDAVDRPTRPGVPGSYRELLDRDTRPVPDGLRADSHPDLGITGVPRDRYLSREFQQLEFEHVWSRTWQMACREEQLPDAGSHVVYDVGDLSLIVVRGHDREIRAFHNSCLHRGTQLRSEGGCVHELRCPFHGFTWELDGTMSAVPCAWDFPQVHPDAFRLPQAQVDTWGGFVFVNPDPDAPSLGEYLGALPENFERFPLEDRFMAAHVAKVLACNWKVGIEAFIEAFHTFAVHPQLVTTSADTITQYDVFSEDDHWSRMITPVGAPSEHVTRDVSDDEILRSMLFSRGDLTIPPGGTVRGVLADEMRAQLAERTGRDFSHLSDAEAIDGIEYFVFPNFFPWAGFLTPLVYRFRPWDDDPGRCLMEVMLLDPLPVGPRPAPAELRFLGEDEPWASAPELGFLGRILDQDTATMPLVQRGLRASVRARTTLSRYQEIRVRHLHALLTRYIGAPRG
ncbi:MAG: (2Fe-2S)-binding protein [Acidimicrobiia bacterium]